MGQHAEDLINGDCDFYTGEYIGRGHGFPRTKYRRKNKPFSEKEKVNGVHNYLRSKGYYDAESQDLVIKNWAFDHGIKNTGKRQITNICCEIQKDFGAFIIWLKNQN